MNRRDFIKAVIALPVAVKAALLREADAAPMLTFANDARISFSPADGEPYQEIPVTRFMDNGMLLAAYDCDEKRDAFVRALVEAEDDEWMRFSEDADDES